MAWICRNAAWKRIQNLPTNYPPPLDQVDFRRPSGRLFLFLRLVERDSNKHTAVISDHRLRQNRYEL